MIRTTTRVRKLRAEFRPAHLAALDQRSREAKLLKSFRAELVAFIGGAPTNVQKALIERAAQLQLRLAIFDQKFAEDGAMSDHATRTYLAWSNSFTRLLAALDATRQNATSSKMSADEALARIREASELGHRGGR